MYEPVTWVTGYNGTVNSLWRFTVPWNETVTMQRLQFVTACLEGELPIAEVCGV